MTRTDYMTLVQLSVATIVSAPCILSRHSLQDYRFVIILSYWMGGQADLRKWSQYEKLRISERTPRGSQNTLLHRNKATNFCSAL